MAFQKFYPVLNSNYQNRLIPVDKGGKLCKKWDKFLLWQMLFFVIFTLIKI